MAQVPALGERIRTARRAAGLTQQALAAEAGVALRSVQAWEAGLSAPRWTTMQRLEQVLGPVGRRVAGPVTPEAVEAEIRAQLAAVDPEVRAAVLARLATARR